MSSMATKKRSTSGSLFSLSCGCKDSKSVSVSVSVSASDTSDKSTSTPRKPRDLSSGETLTLTTASSSSFYDDDRFEREEEEEESLSTPSFSGLLRQLTELEQSVMAVGRNSPSAAAKAEERRRHRRSRSEGGGRVRESVAVVKETADPLGDFRRSMLQMIVEKEIVGGEELRELLRRFLSLNSPRHHDLILRAFAEIWEEVFAGYEDTPDLLRRSHSLRPLPLRRL